MGGDTIELPAGLMDPGEDAATAALRELKEETGYTAQVGLGASRDGGPSCGTHPLTQCRQVVSVSPTACMSPGLTNETVHLVHGMRGQPSAPCSMAAHG
jgi:8-oxo-dGTP pyrophosphatase MutT (NUDIX family)